MSILDELATYAKERVAIAKKRISLEEIKAQALFQEKGDFAFEKALKEPGLSFICECKKASPSKGLIAKDFPYVQIAKDYEAAGASCISVLTEPKWFLGHDSYLKEISQTVHIPCLRKDFVVDEYMIYEAKLLGASAVLLICALLSLEELEKYLALCDQLGLSALVEVHDEEEIEMALKAGARVIGVNNRNLKNFQVDTQNSLRLRQKVSKDVLFVSESGIQNEYDIARLYEMGVDAVLIGETLMKASDKTAQLAQLKRLLPLSTPSTKIKICGLSRLEDIEVANTLLPDYVGFVFAPKSRRAIEVKQAQVFKAALDPNIQVVGVFVNEEPKRIADLLHQGIIDIAQLHGQESPAYLQELQNLTTKPIWQAFRIQNKENLATAFQSQADLILLDAGAGDGQTFDWDVLESFPTHRPYFLAGGLGPHNAALAISHLKPYGLDASSFLETAYQKDPAKMSAFVKEIRKAQEKDLLKKDV